MSLILSQACCKPFLRAIRDPSLDREYVHEVFADFLEENDHPEEAFAQRIAAAGGPELVWCPPGRFTMGSPNNEFFGGNSEKQKKVKLTNGFFLGKYPITQIEYLNVMNENPSYHKSNEWENLPVENVSWLDAIKFCTKLTMRKFNQSSIANLVYFLPTEAQWEYACRAGTTTTNPFGNSLSSWRANFDGNFPIGCSLLGPNLARTSKVGDYFPNPWGLYDILGNVSEWCLDIYQREIVGRINPMGNYQKQIINASIISAQEGIEKRLAPSLLEDSNRVIRGGNWNDGGASLRSANRKTRISNHKYNTLGFRIAALIF